MVGSAAPVLVPAPAPLPASPDVMTVSGNVVVVFPSAPVTDVAVPPGPKVDSIVTVGSAVPSPSPDVITVSGRVVVVDGEPNCDCIADWPIGSLDAEEPSPFPLPLPLPFPFPASDAGVPNWDCIAC
jgi:hypothetical protein